MSKVVACLILCFAVLFFPAHSQPHLVLHKVLSGNITPKSIVHSGNGVFFAQNMMYRHSITIYNRDFRLVKTLSDKIRLADYGFSQYEGFQEGAPVEAAFSPDGHYAWVSNYAMYGKDFSNPGDDNCPPGQDLDPSFVYKIDAEKLAVEAVVQVGSVPKYVAVTPDNRFVLVSNWCSGDLSVIEAASLQEVCRIQMGLYPRGIAIDPQSRFAYVAIMGSSEIAVIDLSDFTVSYLEQVGRAPRHLCISPDGRHLYATLNHVSKVVKIDLHSFQVVDEVNAGVTPRSMALSPDGKWLFVVHYKANQLSRIRTSDMKVTGRVDTREKPIGVTYDPQDRKVWVACYLGNIMVFDDTQPISPPIAEGPGYINPISRIFREASLYAYRKQLLELGSLSARRQTTAVMKPAAPPSPSPATREKEALSGGFCIVLQSFQSPSNALRAQKAFQSKGIETRTLPASGGWHRIAYGSYASAGEARSALKKIQSDHGLQGWVLEIP